MRKRLFSDERRSIAPHHLEEDRPHRTHACLARRILGVVLDLEVSRNDGKPKACNALRMKKWIGKLACEDPPIPQHASNVVRRIPEMGNHHILRPEGLQDSALNPAKSTRERETFREYVPARRENTPLSIRSDCRDLTRLPSRPAREIEKNIIESRHRQLLSPKTKSSRSELGGYPGEFGATARIGHSDTGDVARREAD